jgi:hypothetical protein
MKRFFLTILGVSLFFLGIGALVERTGAKFKSDERALELIRKARTAIGGDAAIASVQSLRIVGKTTHTVKINDQDRTHTGETEIAMMLPDKVIRMVKLGDGGGEGHKIIDKQMDVVVIGDKADRKNRVDVGDNAGGPAVERKIVIKNPDGTVREMTGDEAAKFIEQHPNMPGEKKIVIKTHDGTTDVEKTVDLKAGADTKTGTTADGKKFVFREVDVAHGKAREHHAAMRANEMLRLTLGLLLTAPQGMDVEYTYGGETTIDGIGCNVVNAAFAGQTFKLFLDRSSNLPVAMNYTSMKMPRIMMVHDKVPAPADGTKDVVMFRKHEMVEKAEFQVRFSDFRSTGGVQMPYRWVTTVGGAVDETFDVTSIEVNPANIAERFKDHKVMVRTNAEN